MAYRHKIFTNIYRLKKGMIFSIEFKKELKNFILSIAFACVEGTLIYSKMFFFVPSKI